MRKLFVSLCIMAPLVFMSSCTMVSGYSAGYATPVVYDYSPGWGYAGYGYGSTWYGGTPGYYDTNLYISSW